MKAKIDSILIVMRDTTVTFSIQVSFPEFATPEGRVQTLTFDTSIDAYQAWTPPPGVNKNPKNFIEYAFIRPAYATIKAIQDTLSNVVGKTVDW